MAHARLHIICGNCGCSNMFTYKVEEEYIDIDETVMGNKVYISCENCSTLHDLEDNAKMEQEQ